MLYVSHLFSFYTQWCSTLGGQCPKGLNAMKGGARGSLPEGGGFK